MYPLHPDMPQCSNVPMMTSYVPYYYPVQAPYMIPTPVYPSIKHAATVAVNGYPPQYRYPAVPTGQLIELDAVSVYENEDIRHKKRPESSRRNSTSKSAFSDVTLPSLPRSDTQPTLSKAREDGMGTYESWDYVFRNLSSKDGGRSGYSPSLDRDSRTLDRLDKPHRSRFQPTTLDLEDGLQALTLDHRVEELKKDLKKTKQVTKKISVEEKPRPKRQIESVANPKSDALITPKIAPDKVKLLTKKDIRDRKDVIKQQSSVNGSVSNAAEVKK
ncbi:Tamo, partial [Operophtera brumata]